MSSLVRRAGALVTVVLFFASSSLPAEAGPPAADPGATPSNGPPAPTRPLVRRQSCDVAGGLPGVFANASPPNQKVLDLANVQRLSTGEGQVVAILDTGAQRVPRLPNLAEAGDYVDTTDGLADCDAEGTMVAGIIGGQPAPEDGFVGVAPSARLLSLRVASAKYSVASPGENPALDKAAADVDALARAVVHAADLGATVITIGPVVCVPSDAVLDQPLPGKPSVQAQLGAALRYAAVDKNVLVVAAAGDASGDKDQSRCAANPLPDLARTQDARDWAGATTLSIPSLWQPYVLSVGSLNAQGQPSATALAGPWVGVAAPGESILSLSNSPDGGLANAVLDAQGKPVPVHGSAYAAAYVAGVAALLRSRFPALTAAEAMARIVQTAHNAARLPSNLVGAGVVDPLAALTWDLPAAQARRSSVRALVLPPPPRPAPRAPKLVAYAGVGALAVAVAAALGVVVLRRKRQSR